MKVIALYSIKGGVGKTATAVNLAYIASQEKYRTILIDLDPQGSASYYFRVRAKRKLTTKNLVKGFKNVEKNIRGTDYELLDSLPSNMTFRKMDIVLHNMKRSKKRLNSETFETSIRSDLYRQPAQHYFSLRKHHSLGRHPPDSRDTDASLHAHIRKTSELYRE